MSDVPPIDFCRSVRPPSAERTTAMDELTNDMRRLSSTGQLTNTLEDWAVAMRPIAGSVNQSRNRQPNYSMGQLQNLMEQSTNVRQGQGIFPAEEQPTNTSTRQGDGNFFTMGQSNKNIKVARHGGCTRRHAVVVIQPTSVTPCAIREKVRRTRQEIKKRRKEVYERNMYANILEEDANNWEQWANAIEPQYPTFGQQPENVTENVTPLWANTVSNAMGAMPNSMGEVASTMRESARWSRMMARRERDRATRASADANSMEEYADALERRVHAMAQELPTIIVPEFVTQFVTEVSGNATNNATIESVNIAGDATKEGVRAMCDDTSEIGDLIGTFLDIKCDDDID